MKIFISWSGDQSKVLADAMKDLLHLVFHNIETFMSARDISAGEKWEKKIDDQLQEANFGIICLTPENLDSKWIWYEVGALSKLQSKAKVIPLLHGLELEELIAPINKFHGQIVDKDGIHKVFLSVNKTFDSEVPLDRLSKLFENGWHEFQKKLESAVNFELKKTKKPTTYEMVEELTKNVNEANRKLNKLLYKYNIADDIVGIPDIISRANNYIIGRKELS